MKHKHHIIPKHAGGTDDPSNLVELTVEEHAEAHKKLFEQYGRWQDELAWKALSGHIGKEEIIRLSQSNGVSGDKNPSKRPDVMAKIMETKRKNPKKVWNKGKTKETSEGLKKLSEINKLYREQGKLSNIGDIVRGKQMTDEHRQNLKKSLQMIPKIECPNCKNSFKPGMYKRWHGDKCRGRKR
jgi:hypothetical protein